jgi:hypothetical protein
MTNALSKMKDTVVLLLHDLSLLPQILIDLWQLMIKTIYLIRPGRYSPRIKRVEPKIFPFGYKPTR